ncbi:helix-turn-helix domain-containing protein [Aphanizomenon flos-aquae]|uniref:helix-turn-helix domain-containing protein n=1 Tax=Aphanizomenon flos-aquae TaxID=1176 RepID=UPI00068795E6|nr:helix-turn-helix transcriptional regulator [Aphanizomenon flos-aquae]
MTTSNSENIQKKFGGRLRQIRQNMGLSQEELAHLCNLDRSYIRLKELAIIANSNKLFLMILSILYNQKVIEIYMNLLLKRIHLKHNKFY